MLKIVIILLFSFLFCYGGLNNLKPQKPLESYTLLLLKTMCEATKSFNQKTGFNDKSILALDKIIDFDGLVMQSLGKYKFHFNDYELIELKKKMKLAVLYKAINANNFDYHYQFINSSLYDMEKNCCHTDKFRWQKI